MEIDLNLTDWSYQWYQWTLNSWRCANSCAHQRIQYTNKPMEYTMYMNIHCKTASSSGILKTMNGERCSDGTPYRSIQKQFMHSMREHFLNKACEKIQVNSSQRPRNETSQNEDPHKSQHRHEMTFISPVSLPWLTHILLQIIVAAVAAQLQTNTRLPYPLPAKVWRWKVFPRLRLSKHITQ